MIPSFLDVQQVIELQNEQIRRFGGEAGLRDPGLLESAVAMPRQTFGGQYLHTSIGAMAAAYLFHICKNHPFMDGNKRAAAHTADTFLRGHGLRLNLMADEFAAFVLAVADGTLSKDQVTKYIRDHLDEDPPVE